MILNTIRVSQVVLVVLTVKCFRSEIINQLFYVPLFKKLWKTTNNQKLDLKFLNKSIKNEFKSVQCT